jgi:hypothetical protein
LQSLSESGGRQIRASKGVTAKFVFLKDLGCKALSSKEKGPGWGSQSLLLLGLFLV